MGAFHSTKNSGMKFRVFHVTNGTVFSGLFEPSRPSPSRTNFCAKIPNKQGNQKKADSYYPFHLAREQYMHCYNYRHKECEKNLTL